MPKNYNHRFKPTSDEEYRKFNTLLQEKRTELGRPLNWDDIDDVYNNFFGKPQIEKTLHKLSPEEMQEIIKYVEEDKKELVSKYGEERANLLLGPHDVHSKDFPWIAFKARMDWENKFRKKDLSKINEELSVGQDHISLLDLVKKVLPDKSNGHIRQLILDGAVSLNGEKIKDLLFFDRKDLVDKVLKVGKFNFVKLIE